MTTTRTLAISKAKSAHRLWMTHARDTTGIERFAIAFADRTTGATHWFYDVEGWRVELRGNGALVMASRINVGACA